MNLLELASVLKAALEYDDIENWEETKESFDEKLEACFYVLNELKAEEQKLKELSKHYANKASATKNNIASLKRWIEMAAAVAGIESYKGTLGTLYTKSSTELRYIPEQIPEEYMEEVVEKRPNMQKIRELLEEGETLSFADLVVDNRLIARLK